PGAVDSRSCGTVRWCDLRWQSSGGQSPRRLVHEDKAREAPRKKPAENASANQLLESGIRPHDGLRAFRAGGNASNLDAGTLFEKSQVLLGERRKRIVVRDAKRGGLPTRQDFEHRLHLLDIRDRRRHIAYLATVDAVTHAYGDLVKVVKHVELGDHYGIETVDDGGVAEQRDIEPAAAARAAGHGTEFVAARADLVSGRIESFGGERAAAHARNVGLGDTDNSGDSGRRNPGPGAGAAGAGAGRSDERVRAMVDIEHRPLRAF